MSNRKRLLSFLDLLKEDLSLVEKNDPRVRFAIERLAARCRKRAELGDKSLAPAAVADFVKINDRMGSFIVDIPDDVARNARHFLTVVLERYTTSLSELNIQLPLDHTHLLELWRFGPGASFDTVGTHVADKIRQSWTVTSSAAPVVQYLRRNHPYLSRFDAVTQGCREARGSRLSTVPKNEEKERTIAIEPCGNMVAQLGAGQYLANALRFIGLDIARQQEKNRFLAGYGSVTGTLATLDLSSASDTIHVDLVTQLFPSAWAKLLMALRCEETSLPDGTWVRLNMISTMGNGFTFPLMTLILAALLYGFRCTRGGPSLYINWTYTAIYGDDIIIPIGEYEGFTQLLERCGFMVNHEKSFSSGPFRESCGFDAYEGYDVTPFYVRRLECDADVYVTLNKLTDWCGRHGIYLPKSTLFLFSLLGDRVHFVPEWSQPFAGYRCTQVRRRYKELRPLQVELTIRGDDLFLMPLACGGYVTSSASGGLYMPRQLNHKMRYVTVKNRLPQGFLDGRDPLTRTSSTSSLADFIASHALLAVAPVVEP